MVVGGPAIGEEAAEEPRFPTRKGAAVRLFGSPLLWFAIVAVLVAALLPFWLSGYILGVLTVA
jgi:hypothetical protein